MKRLVILTLAVAMFGCAGAQQQKDAEQMVDAAVAVAKAASDLGLVDAKTSKDIKTVTDTIHVAREVVEQVQTMDMVVVQPKDTLWSIAAEHYAGNIRAPRGKGGFLWPAICHENNLNNCDLIKPFQILRVPKPETIANMPISQVVKYLNTAYKAD